MRFETKTTLLTWTNYGIAVVNVGFAVQDIHCRAYLMALCPISAVCISAAGLMYARRLKKLAQAGEEKVIDGKA